MSFKPIDCSLINLLFILNMYIYFIDLFKQLNIQILSKILTFIFLMKKKNMN
jgi:hypothetical protein